MLKILLLVDYTRESERRLLKGLVQYANTRGGCIAYPISNIPLDQTGYSEKIKAKARLLGVDAIFGFWPDADKGGANELGIPVVLRTQNREFEDFPMLSGRYNEIGRCAANFFLHQHYRNYAFIGHRDVIWSEGRLEGFTEALASSGFKPDVYRAGNILKEWEAISQWLSDLPKSVALFACNDMMAQKVNEICLSRNIRVPEDIAILGADDDEFLCNITCPTLSSIRLNFEKQGYELGRVIFDMVETGKIWPARIAIEPSTITERGSTLKHNISDPYVKSIVSYLDLHFADLNALEDILATIPLSRRAVEIRFRKEMSPETMVSYLTRLRVNNMASLLSTSELSISRAAEISGFTDNANAGRTFKKYLNISPSAWRKTKH